MNIIYLILAVIFYIIGAIIGFNQKVNGDQSEVSSFEGNNPILSSLNPLGQPFYILIIIGILLYLFNRS